MALESRIKWKKGDYITLGKAVADFNKKINKLNAEENKLYLPNTIKYEDVKQNITTRKELNRVINSLKRFKQEGAEDLYITKAGEQLTKWERKELSIQTRIAKNRLNRELTILNIPNEQGFTRVQMGSEREKVLKRQIENLNKLEFEKGYDFKRLKERIIRNGTSDYTMKKAIVYRENYMNELEKYRYLDNYDKLMEKLNSLQNPLSFYEFMSKDELTEDLTYQSEQFYTQQAFNSFLQRLGIEIDIDSMQEIIK